MRTGSRLGQRCLCTLAASMRRISEDDLDVDNHNSDNPEIVRVYWQCLNKRWEECNDYSFDVDNHSFGYYEIVRVNWQCLKKKGDRRICWQRK